MDLVEGKQGKKRQSRQYFFTAGNKDASFPQYFLRKRLIGSRENKERKDKVGNTFLPPAVRDASFPQYFLRKRRIRWRENKERKDKVGNTFLPPAIRTLLFLNLF
jgi:hypothetical protein